MIVVVLPIAAVDAAAVLVLNERDCLMASVVYLRLGHCLALSCQTSYSESTQ